LLLFH